MKGLQFIPLYYRCDFGFTGPECTVTDCSDVNNCSAHGTCSEPNLCECDEGYGGTMCQDVTCEILNKCSGKNEE